MRWNHPKTGVLVALPAGLQPVKVWKHLYSLQEDWAALGIAVDGLIARITTLGAPAPTGRELPAQASAGVLSALRAQHDGTWAPLYGSELVAGDTLVARSQEDGRWLFVSNRGVFAAADDSRGDGAVVLSVYRPHPEGLNVPWSNGQYRRRALNRWIRETRMSAPDPLAALAEVTLPPSDAAGTWELALALARARLAAPDSAMVQRAERALAASPYRPAATPSQDAVLDAVERAIREDDDDPLRVLLALEDALLVTSELSGEAVAEALADRAGDLLEWAPGSWSRAAPFARRQSQAPPCITAFWARAADVLTASAIREQPAGARPGARLTDILLPVTRRRHTARLLRVPSTRVVRQAPAAPAYVPPGWRAAAAHLSGNAGWAVVPPTEIRSPTVQAWIVDDQHPAGEDITAEFRASAGTSVWTLDPGDEAEIIWVEGIKRASTLNAALDLAEAESSARVGVATVTRPR